MPMNQDTLRDLIDAKWAANDPDGYGASEHRPTLKANLVAAVAAAVVEHLQTDAAVAFTAGQITGVVDTMTGSPAALAASGGAIT